MEPVSNIDKRAALAEALASETFARSEQLRAFLAYICEMDFSGRGADLTEYLIGVKALGRSPDYSPSEDSSVRTRAYELRQRLQKLYSVEKPQAKVRIDLPKGSYVPRFTADVPVPVPSPTPPISVQPEQVAANPPMADPAPLPWRISAWIVPFVVGSLLSGAVVGIWAHRIHTDVADPIVVVAWEPIIGKEPEVLVSLSTPLHMLVTPYMGQVPEGTKVYPAPEPLYRLFSRFRNLPPDAKLEMQPVQKSVLMGAVESVVRVASTLELLHKRVRLLPEAIGPLTALRSRGVVLIGSPWYSRNATILLEKTPWTTRWDPESKQVGIYGQGPREGQKFLPRRDQRGNYSEVFGLITVLPNDTGGISDQGGHSIVVLSGLTSAGTHGATSYFTSPAELSALSQRFQKEGLARWPRSFQLIVRCRTSDDAQLLSFVYETHDILNK